MPQTPDMHACRWRRQSTLACCAQRALFRRVIQSARHDTRARLQVVAAEYAFVLHTAHPVTGERGRIFGEVVCGLGETLVGNYAGKALSFCASPGRPLAALGARCGTCVACLCPDVEVVVGKIHAAMRQRRGSWVGETDVGDYAGRTLSSHMSPANSCCTSQKITYCKAQPPKAASLGLCVERQPHLSQLLQQRMHLARRLPASAAALHLTEAPGSWQGPSLLTLRCHSWPYSDA